jgi:endoglucanase
MHGSRGVMSAVPLVALAALVGCGEQATTWRLDPAWKLDEGGVVRGRSGAGELALVFTGDDCGEGTAHILDTLRAHRVKASFFVTGNYIEQPQLVPMLERMVSEGHYLGPHSQGHLQYCPWDERGRSLVTEQEFKDDLRANLRALRELGGAGGRPVYFIPPFEWYNARHVAWARDLDCLLFNYTPGSGSHRDWAPEGHAAFRPSRQIFTGILACEQTDPDGLGGHLLLLHLGSLRDDKMYLLLDELIDTLHARGYKLVRVDELLPVQRGPVAGGGADSPLDVDAQLSVEWSYSIVN